MVEPTNTTAPQPAASTLEWHFGWRLVICIAAIVLTALPIALHDNMPLIDYPEHLADFYIRANLTNSSDLQKFYTLEDGTFPYWGVRGFIAASAPWIGVENALRLFAVCAALMPAIAGLVVSYAVTRRITLVPLLGLFFVYNEVLYWGFLNYLFCGGLALIVFAGWIASTGYALATRLIALCLAAICMIWMHPFSAVLLGLCVCLWEVADWLRTSADRQRPVDGLFKIVLVGAAFVPAGLSLMLLGTYQAASQFLYSGDFTHRIWVAVSPLWMAQSSLILAFGGLVSALIAALIASKVLHLRANFGRLFIYLMVAAYVTPITVFGVFNASVRIPTFAAILLVAGLALSDRLQRWRAPSLVLIAILLGIKLALINLVLSKGSAEVSEFREAAKVISAGNRVATVVFDRSNRNFPGSTSGKPVNWDRFQNLDSYLIVDRQAFVPNIFGVLGTDYQPEYKQHTRPLGKPVPQQLLLIEWKQWPEPYKSRDQFMRDWRNAFDYILSIDLGHRPQLPAGVTVLHTGSYFQILKVAKGG